jgi:hypothetical protein
MRPKEDQMSENRWLRRFQAKGHDTFGAFELTIGAAILFSYLVRTVLSDVVWLGSVIFYLSMAGALWYGHRLETRSLRTLGRLRVWGTLFLRFTWLVVLWSFLWSYALLLFAHALAWDVQIPGWRDGPILLVLILAMYHLTLGVKMLLRRWIGLGAVLILWSVLVPSVPFLRQRMFLTVALLVGGALLISGYQGRQRFIRLRSSSES